MFPRLKKLFGRHHERSIPAEVDVIVCGGGAAGCIVAGRLAAADPSLQVLIIEAGANNLNKPDVIRPGVFLSHLRPDSTTAKFYSATKSEYCAGRSVIVPSGNVLGGGSSINFMMYTRASASDYDDWKTEGWSAKDLMPLLRKIETYHLHDQDPAHSYAFDDVTHGSSGPLQVTYGGFRDTVLMEQFVDAAQNRGYPLVNDMNDLSHSNGVQRWGKWIGLNGHRQDSAHHYVHPLASHGNLHVLCDSKVVKIVTENGKAVGVEHVPSKAPANGSSTQTRITKARRLVVISCGSIASPGVLERSGIGDPEVLSKAGIETIVDLPGVGSKYHDHNLTCPVYHVSGIDTHDDINRGEREALKKAAKLFAQGKGKYTSNYIDAAIKCRPNEKELEELGPSFRKVWDTFYQDAPDKPVMLLCPAGTLLGDYSLAPPGNYVTMVYYPAHPKSCGSVHIRSASPYVDPEFDPGYLSHDADLPVMVWGYKLGRELIRRMPCYRGEAEMFHPKFAADSEARCKAIDIMTPKAGNTLSAGIVPVTVAPAFTDPNGAPSTQPAGDEIKDIEYSDADNRAIEQFVQETIGTTWHSLGTNPMKPRASGGVVDAKLNVYGIENLKVVDLSICPENVGANTYSTALLVGEKGAVLAAEHLGRTAGLG